MKTFIEQKDDIKRQIIDLERRNQQLYNEIDNNEAEIIKLQKTLAIVGTPAGEDSIRNVASSRSEK